MWRRDAFFIGLLLFGFLAVANVLSRELPKPAASVSAVSLANASDDALSRSLDEALRHEWRSRGLEPTQRADELLVARRISLALVGTIPSLEEIRMIQSVPAETRAAWWVDHLLADRRWADYMGERLARVYVGSEEGPFLIYRRRRFVQWLAEQLHAGRPYDELVRGLVKSDGIWTDEPATNFVTVAINPDTDEVSETQLAGRVARAFLGVRIDCAECHDHPFDDWQQDEFQSLAAFFGGTASGLTGVHEGEEEYQFANPGEEPRVFEPGAPFHSELLPKSGHTRARLADWITHPENEAFGRATVNRIWALMFGRPLIEPVDNIDPEAELIGVLDVLADDFVKSGYDLKRLIRTIVLSDMFQLESKGRGDQSITDKHQEYWAAFPMVRLRPEQLVRGVMQAASLHTIDHQSHVVVRLARTLGQSEFVKRFGDAGADELEIHGATIPQQLLMMNGKLVAEKTKHEIFTAAGRIGMLAPDDTTAVGTAYLTVLSRAPTDAEKSHFLKRLEGTSDKDREAVLEDMYWALVNSTEFSWNH